MTAAAALSTARTFLFVPGDRPDRFDKAVGAGADAVILDLEDAVAPDAKDRAREAIVGWLAEASPQVPVLVRCNAAGTPQHDADLSALVEAAPTAVVLPKAEDPDAVAPVAARLPVLALVETAHGIHRAAAIAGVPGVRRLCLGHLDLAADLGCSPSRAAMLHARSQLVLASRLAGLPAPVDGVTTSTDDEELLRTDVGHALDLGLTAKLLIHPRQVAWTHVALQPPAEQVAWAERVLAADGSGAAAVDGEMVDAPVLARARQVMARVQP